MRAVPLACAALLLGAACSSHGVSNAGKEPDTGAHPMTSDATPSPPKTTLEQVQRWAPAGAGVSDAGFAVPGVELFRIDTHEPVKPEGYATYPIVAIVGGVGAPILQGDDVTRAVIKVIKDPKQLATIALAVNRRAGMLLDGPRDDQQRKQGVSAPKLAGGAVELWLMAGSPGLSLYHGRLDLASGKLELAEPEASPGEELDNAIAALDGSGYVAALDTLKQHCADPKASKALFAALATGAREDLRARAAMAVEACGAAAAVEPLVRALEQDKATAVRATAAATLGRLGDKRARPALEKAAQSKDDGVAYSAKEALKKLRP